MDNKYETWEYWENKFKGMTEEEIEKYWENERREATDEVSIAMDFADECPGIRAEIVEGQYQRYLAAKKQHEAIMKKAEVASLEAVNKEGENIKENFRENENGDRSLED